MNGDNIPLYSADGRVVCDGYKRIVIGDYGAFIEFTPEQANHYLFKVQEGQEYRINDPKYSKNVKYEWLTLKDKSGIKIYKQKKTVSYADYKKGMFYVSPHEVYSEIPIDPDCELGFASQVED